MILEPEQERRTASLTIAYNDLKRVQDLYAFIPSLRRYQPVSTTARCGQTPAWTSIRMTIVPASTLTSRNLM